MLYESTFPDSANHACLEKVLKDFFVGNPVSVEVNFSGQGLDEKNDFVLGCRAGPGIHITNLFHEMGHLSERPISKLVQRPAYAWGFYFGKPWELLGRSGEEPQTDASVHTEKRAWAYQLSLQKHYGCVDKEDPCIVSSATWLPAWMFYKNNVVDEATRKSLGFQKSDNRAIEILMAEVELLSETTFTMKHFQQAWSDRMIALNETVV